MAMWLCVNYFSEYLYKDVGVNKLMGIVGGGRIHFEERGLADCAVSEDDDLDLFRTCHCVGFGRKEWMRKNYSG